MIKNILFIVSFILMMPQFKGLTQNEEQIYNDSLERAMPQAVPDTNKVLNLNYLCGTYWFKDGVKAIDFANQALKLSQELGFKTGECNSYNNLGIINAIEARYALALEFHGKSLKISKEENLLNYMANSYGNIGIVYGQQGKSIEALQYQFMALEIIEKLNSPMTLARNYQNLGTRYLEVGNYKDANIYLNKSLKIHEELKLSGPIAQNYRTLGIVCTYQGKYAEALKYHLLDLKMRDEAKDTANRAASLHNIGVVYTGLGKESEALEKYKEALDINRYYKNRYWAAINLNGIGNIYRDQGNYSEAVATYTEALMLAKEIEDKVTESMSYSELGNTASKLKNHTEAEELYLKAINISKEIGDKKNLALNYANFAEVNIAQKKFTNADDLLRLSIDIANEIELLSHVSDIYKIFAVLESARNNWTTAMEYENKQFHASKSFLLSNISSFTESEKTDIIKKSADNTDFFYSSAFTSTNLHDSAHQWLYDYQLFQRGIVLESSEGLADAVQQNPKLKEPWNKYSMYKNAVGKEYLLPKEDRREDLAALEDSANAAERELLSLSLPFRNWKERVNANWKDVQKHLKPKEAAIEFVSFRLEHNKVSSDSVMYAAMILTPSMKYPKFVSLFEENQLSALIKSASLRGISGEVVPANALQYSNALYQLIINPLLPYLKNVESIAFVPDGLLYKVNLASITDTEGKLLCESFNLRQLNTTRSIVFPSPEPVKAPASFYGGIDYTYVKESETTQPVSVMQNIDLLSSRNRGDDFGFLTGAKNEVETLSGLYKSKKLNYELKENKEASEQSFKKMQASSPAVLHIATHGFYFPPSEKKGRQYYLGESNYSLTENPLNRSGLVLAGGNYAWEHGGNPNEDEDGILFGYEIAQMNLSNTSVLVLSACETALGDIKGTEGVYGLQRAFKMAGVDYIIMSLWSVPDKETQEFMQTFYSKWVGGQPIRESFSQTQKEMAKKHDPQAWAAFVLVE